MSRGHETEMGSWLLDVSRVALDGLLGGVTMQCWRNAMHDRWQSRLQQGFTS